MSELMDVKKVGRNINKIVVTLVTVTWSNRGEIGQNVTWFVTPALHDVAMRSFYHTVSWFFLALRSSSKGQTNSWSSVVGDGNWWYSGGTGDRNWIQRSSRN